MPVVNRFADLYEDIVAWRRDLHENPELGFDCHRTGKVVEEKLKAFGCDEVVTGLATTGVVGVIKGRGGSGRTIGLRSDMDALPILEASGKDHASKIPGKMHACGHDGHTAMLLGAAQYLAETRNFDGNVAVIFQPAEEGGGGGQVMVDEGMMDRFGIEKVYGMHNAPGLPTGLFAIRPGPILASADEFEITIEGSGGHAAKPHMAVDPTIGGAHIMTALQSIVARNADPLDQLVISATAMTTSVDTFNVIPSSATILGTVRTFQEPNRALAERRIRELATGVASGMGLTATVRYEWGYPVTVNDDDEAMFMADVADEISGPCIRDTPPVMAAEDFAFMLNARPGAMISIGNGDSAPVHHPAFDFADEAIPAGCSFWVRLVERALPLQH